MSELRYEVNGVRIKDTDVLVVPGEVLGKRTSNLGRVLKYLGNPLQMELHFNRGFNTVYFAAMYRKQDGTLYNEYEHARANLDIELMDRVYQLNKLPEDSDEYISEKLSIDEYIETELLNLGVSKDIPYVETTSSSMYLGYLTGIVGAHIVPRSEFKFSVPDNYLDCEYNAKSPEDYVVGSIGYSVGGVEVTDNDVVVVCREDMLVSNIIISNVFKEFKDADKLEVYLHRDSYQLYFEVLIRLVDGTLLDQHTVNVIDGKDYYVADLIEIKDLLSKCDENTDAYERASLERSLKNHEEDYTKLISTPYSLVAAGENFLKVITSLPNTEVFKKEDYSYSREVVTRPDYRITFR